ncbi:MAG: hypothetical protein DRO39_02465 [Thermoprotei archaeon]|nr:MAG: hypothetical protein DRO39_02465 [Thermoprotei archaeon]
MLLSMLLGAAALIARLGALAGPSPLAHVYAGVARGAATILGLAALLLLLATLLSLAALALEEALAG